MTEKTIIVPVSGGKDSQVVLSLALKQSLPVVCVHQNTGFDHPLTYQTISEMEAFYGVAVEHTHNKLGGMFGFLEKAGYFPNSGARGCTQRLKQEPFANWLIEKEYNKSNCEIWFGMRSDESATRANKYGDISTEDVFTLADVSGFYGKGKIQFLGGIPCKLPIVDWDTEKVFAYLKNEGAPLNPLYARGHHRVGCYPCLLARKAEWVSAVEDEIGRSHIKRLISIEDKWRENGNPRKYIKVHPKWDVRNFLKGSATELPDLNDGECGYCSI